MTKLIILLLLIFTFQIQGQYEGFPKYVNYIPVTSDTTDTTPPDTSGLIIATITGIPDSLTISFNPSAINSTDWKEISFIISHNGWIGTPIPTSITIPKSIALADSDTVVVFSGFYYTNNDTTNIISVTPTVTDSSNNSIAMGVKKDTLILTRQPLAWTEYQSADFTISSSNSTEVDVIMTYYFNYTPYSSSLASAVPWITEADVRWSPLTFSAPVTSPSIPSQTLAGLSSDSSLTSESVIELYPADIGRVVTLQGWRELYRDGTQIYYKTGEYDTLDISVYTIVDVFPPLQDTFVAEEGLNDSVHFSGNHVEGVGDSICIDTASTTLPVSPLSGWVKADTFSIGFAFDVDEYTVETFFLYSKDSLDNYIYPVGTLEYEVTTINDAADVTAPTLAGGVFTATFDSVFQVDIDTTSIFYSSDSDMYYMLLEMKDESDEMWTSLGVVYNDTLSPVSYDIPISFSNDSGFVRISFVDSSSNSAVVAIDTFTVTWFQILAESDTVRNVLEEFKVLRNTGSGALAGSDSTISILISDADTTTNGADSLQLGVGNPNDDIGAYYSTRVMIDGEWQDTVSVWKWHPAPDSAGSFIVSESATADSDSVAIVFTGQPPLVDSVTVFYDPSSYALTNRLYSYTDTLHNDTTILFPGNADATYYFSAVYYYNGSNSAQTGAEGANTDTCAVPIMGGGLCESPVMLEEYTGGSSNNNSFNSNNDTCFNSWSNASAFTGWGDSLWISYQVNGGAGDSIIVMTYTDNSGTAGTYIEGTRRAYIYSDLNFSSEAWFAAPYATADIEFEASTTYWTVIAMVGDGFQYRNQRNNSDAYANGVWQYVYDGAARQTFGDLNFKVMGCE